MSSTSAGANGPDRPDAGADADPAPEVERRIGAAWRELRRGASMGGLRAYLYGCGDDAIDLGQVDTLDLLAQRPTWRMRELAGALRVDASTATRAVDRLVAAGWADRRRDEIDARVVVVALTDEGRRRHDVVVERRREAMHRILHGFDEGERGQLAALLERLIAGVDDFVAEEAGPERS
jgi:DNA-binding MarR family transcriptional regulator